MLCNFNIEIFFNPFPVFLYYYLKNISDIITMNTETWKQVEAFPNYIISNTGLLKNTKTKKVIKPHLSNTGYYVCSMSNNGKISSANIHTLVAKAFVDNPNPALYTEVHHIDGDKLNNNADNLKWVTRQENLGKPKTEYQILRTYLLNSIHNLFHEANDKGLDLTNVVNEILMFSKDVVATNSLKKAKIEIR